MKKLLLLFGLLDFITLIIGYKDKSMLITDFTMMQLINILIYVSLLISGFYLIRQKKIGILISYFQFPLRIIFA